MDKWCAKNSLEHQGGDSICVSDFMSVAKLKFKWRRSLKLGRHLRHCIR